MSRPLPKHVLEALDTFYADPTRWARGAWACQADGTALPRGSIHSEAAYSLCLESGIRVFARRLSAGWFARLRAMWTARRTIVAIRRQVGLHGGLPSYNDNSTYEQVRQTIKKTVAAL